jgi:hypothetical protein
MFRLFGRWAEFHQNVFDWVDGCLSARDRGVVQAVALHAEIVVVAVQALHAGSFQWLLSAVITVNVGGPLCHGLLLKCECITDTGLGESGRGRWKCSTAREYRTCARAAVRAGALLGHFLCSCWESRKVMERRPTSITPKRVFTSPACWRHHERKG